MSAITVSVVLLWLAVAVLALLLWALSRQVGVLFERVAPMGALVTDAGPPVGSPAPAMALSGLQSESLRIGGEQAQPTLLFFLSPDCPVCKKLIPALKGVARDEKGKGKGRGLRVVLASDGERGDHLAFIRKQGLEQLPYVLSTELGMAFRVSRLPYVVVMDTQGRIAAKGLVNSREQFDSLLNAHDMSTPSIQQYLEHDHGHAHPA